MTDNLNLPLVDGLQQCQLSNAQERATLQIMNFISLQEVNCYP